MNHFQLRKKSELKKTIIYGGKEYIKLIKLHKIGAYDLNEVGGLKKLNK